MKKIVGVMTTTDGGKSLLIDIINTNFSSNSYINMDDNMAQLVGTENYINEINSNCSFKEIYNLIQKYGCEILNISDVRNNLSRTELNIIFNMLTKKRYIFCFIRPNSLVKYCDYGIFVGRDLRACWVVTRHRDNGVKKYLSDYYPGGIGKFRGFLLNSQNHDSMVIKFEDLIANQEKITREMMALTGLNLDHDKFIHSTPQYNTYFTMIDLLNMRKYSDDTRIIRNEELEYLSYHSKEFNKFFNNKETLTLDDLLPPTIITDIEDYVKNECSTPL